MTSDTLTRQHPAEPAGPGGSARVPRAGLVRLTGLELRKMVDTRAGFWLLVVLVLGALAVDLIQLIWGTEANSNLDQYLQLALIPVVLLLPVLGILTVTSEWSQRTALTTFTLTPERHRVAIAKFAAANLLALASLVVSVLTAAFANLLSQLFDHGAGSWHLGVSVLPQALLLQVLNVTMGVAFGMLLLNSPLAIVLYFLLPTVWQILTGTITAIQSAAAWLDVSGAMEPLFDASMHGQDWPKLATSSLVWIAVPLALGTLRLLRREVK